MKYIKILVCGVCLLFSSCSSNKIEETDDWIKVKTQINVMGVSRDSKEVWIDQRRLNIIYDKRRSNNNLEYNTTERAYPLPK